MGLYETYKGKRVMIQLHREHPLFAVAYGGMRTVRGESVPMLKPATLSTGANGEAQYGYADVIPDCEISGNSAALEDTIMVVVNDPTGAEIEVSIPLDNIEYILAIVKAPSPLVV